MTAVVQHELGPFTVADWHALPAREDGTRLELIEGYWLVTPPPSGQHQWAEKRFIKMLDKSLERGGREDDLYVLGGVGVELSTEYRSALVPDFVVLDVRPIGTSFQAKNVVLAGEIWSPGNSHKEQRDKFDSYASAGIPFFWSVAQDRGGPVEMVCYRLEHGRYVPENTVKRGDGPVSVSAAPVTVDVDIASLRP